MRLTRKHAIRGAVLLAAGAIGAFMLRPKPVEVDVGRVVRAPLRVTVDGEARTRVRSRYVITAPVAGRLERATVTEGDTVRAGAVVARLTPLPLDEQGLAAARAHLASAEAGQREADARAGEARLTADQAARTLARYRAVESIGGLSPAQREQAELEARVAADVMAAALIRRDAAAQEVRAARAVLAGTAPGSGASVVLVRAPTAGRVLRITERSERIVAAGMPVLEVGDPCDLEVIVDLLSTDAVRVVPGTPVELVAWGGDAVLRGRVRSIEPSAMTRVSALGVDEQRVNVIVDAIDAPEALGDGFRLDARIVVWEGRDRVTAPASAVFRTADGWHAFAVRDGRAVLRTVRIGHRSDAAVDIVGGLTEGEVVVLFPSDQLRDGMRVRAR
jgi:HlyD family secretion protein